MKTSYILLIIIVFLTAKNTAQTANRYHISFKNAVHHKAEVTVVFSDVESEVLEVRMSRTSPGRYALHEFAKNVYNLKAFDSKGNRLPVTRPNPYQWNISKHDGTVNIIYTLFANRGGGTYSQIDETHAHLNIPATFMYASAYTERPINVTFERRKDLQWKIATQLKSLGNDTYFAPNLDYFMDSPIEISNFSKRTFTINSNGKTDTYHFVLHHKGTEQELDTYIEKVKKIIPQEIAIFGEPASYDYGEYTFLACYMPHVSGDGMEHRNSTILTSTKSLLAGGMQSNISTVSHEFFHSWNVERIRPKSLKPFSYEEANMSGELWFAEGFTSYYSSLVLCRAGIISKEQYVKSLTKTMNYVWNSPARTYFNPIEMSYQAPFVDAATSVDPVNRENMFISYYSYGSVLGLALDLSLRNLDSDKNLDDFMKLVWKTYGKTEIGYTVNDLQNLLSDYVGITFSNHFFNNFIFDSKMPNYKELFSSVGIRFEQTKLHKASFGATLNNMFWLQTNPFEGSAAYKAGLENRDKLISIDGMQVPLNIPPLHFTTLFKPNQTVKIVYNRFGELKETKLTFDADKSYTIIFKENVSERIEKRRQHWLEAK